jgi:hypothetical protein
LSEKIPRLTVGSITLLLTIAMGALFGAQNRPVLSLKLHTENGVPVHGATIRVQRDQSFALQAISDAEGKAEIPALPAGQYTIVITADGFQENVLPIAIYDIRQVIETDVTLVPTLRRSEAVDVVASADEKALESAAPPSAELRSSQMETLPSRPATVTEALPLVPGVIRSPNGEIQMGGQGEQKSALLVNAATATDPATGRFATTVPVDSVDSITVLQTPFLPQYGGFTTGVVAVETRRGGEKWRFSLKEPFPDMRVRSGHVRGLRDATPRLSFGGPILTGKLFFAEAVQYKLEKKQTRTLPFPNNESKDELVNSFSQFDYIISPAHFITANIHLTPHHINFVDPQFFNPQPVTPSFRGHDRTLTVTDHAVVLKGLLDSTVNRQVVGSRIGAQSEADMVLTPTGNTGAYFARRHRDSTRSEWTETLSLNGGATHALKFGTLLARVTNRPRFDFRSVQVVDTAGDIIKRIDFTQGAEFNKTDIEQAFFVQDHWSVLPRLSLDGGVREEFQARTSAVRFGPRIAAAWTPIPHDPIVVRTGYGVFYDRVPLAVYSFEAYPQQLVTSFDPSGATGPASTHFLNIIEPDTSSTFPFVIRSGGSGNFAPHSQTWTVGTERSFGERLHIRMNYQRSNSKGGLLLTPGVQVSNDVLVLSGGGRAAYRQLEITARTSWSGGQQMLFSFVHSKAQGDLNTFSTYINDFPFVPLRSGCYCNTQADIPNRFLAWGILNMPWKMHVTPMFEFHTGQPYAMLQANRDYIGTPYGDRTRFRSYVNLDQRLSKDVTVKKKYTARISMSVLNTFNHFNPLDVHANMADPLRGTFFGHYKRRYRADFELLF